MFDLFLTIALIWFAYRGYQWYQRMQGQVGPGRKPHDKLHDMPEPEDRDDYIDYEEVK
ncbi:hypothetical protein [Lewinella sp. IMCC34191]|uniref:hypothetical protein n=1 Tax=Lewinella sp. IMCC34191 TaxID=2259172 RepID=UPI001300391D|nr:hypothetical protein [Lewinella sp. IMCC34191]